MEIQSGSCLALHEDCSPSVLISSGLELEEQQYVFSLIYLLVVSLNFSQATFES